MNKEKLNLIALLSFCLLLFNSTLAQVKTDGTVKDLSEISSPKSNNSRFGGEVRGNNAFTIAGGTSVMNGDLIDPLFEVYFQAGYKRFLGPYVNLNLTYHKFNLAYKDAFNEGFMSFDLNVEVNFLPYNSFTPFIYAGGGLNASNYFKETDTKIQGGAGIEYLVSSQLGIKLFTDYSHVFSDELDGSIYGEADDVYWRMAFGLNFYFGGHGRTNRLAGDSPTVIKSNPIVDDY